MSPSTSGPPTSGPPQFRLGVVTLTLTDATGTRTAHTLAISSPAPSLHTPPSGPDIRDEVTTHG